jgi:acyl carrier protein
MNTNEKTDLKQIILDKIAQIKEVDVTEIDPDQHFMDMGIASVEAMSIFVAIQKQGGIIVSPLIMFECNTVNEICDYLDKKEAVKG